MKRLLSVLAIALTAFVAAGQEYNSTILLDPAKAVLVNASRADALESDREFTRMWGNIPNKFLEDLAAEVRGRRTEGDPKADLRTYSGTWRISYVEIRRGKDGDGQLYETLRYGLATTLATGEARLGEHDGDPLVGGFRFRQFWPYVDPTYVDTLVVALNNITNVVNPQADAQTYTGLFVASQITSKRLDDAAIEVSRWLTKVNSPSNSTMLSALPYRIIEDNTILRLFGIETGEGDYRACIWDNLSPEESIRTNLLITVSDAQLVSAFAVGWTYAERHWKDQKDNTGTFIAVFRKSAWTNTSGSTGGKVPARTNIWGYANYVPDTAAEGLDVKKFTGSDGIPTADIPDMITNVTVEGGYALDSVRADDSGDGQSVLRTTMTKQRGTAVYVIQRFQPAVGNREESQTIYWHNLTAGNATSIYNDATLNYADMTASTYYASPAGHQLAYVGRDALANGLYDITRVTTKPNYGLAIWPESTAVQSNNFEDVDYKSLGTNIYVKTNFWFTLVSQHATANAAWAVFDEDVKYRNGSGVYGDYPRYKAVRSVNYWPPPDEATHNKWRIIPAAP